MATINQNTTDLQALLNLANSLPEKVDTSGTATAADIYTGKTATVNDQKITGTNPYNAANVDPAVTSALTALADKGVDTTGADLFDLAELIAAIEAGGGGSNVAYGSFTPTSAVDSYTLTHGLGKVPDFIMLVRKGDNQNELNAKILLSAVASAEADIQSFSACYSKSSGTYNYTKDGNASVQNKFSSLTVDKGQAFWEATSDTVLIRPNSFGQLTANEYYWIAY